MAHAGTEIKCAEILKTNAAFNVAADSSIATGTTYSVEAKNKNIILAVVPNTAGTLTIKKGEGFAAVKDIDIAITASKVNWIELDTTPFLRFDGDDKGYIVVATDSTLAGKMHVVSAL